MEPCLRAIQNPLENRGINSSSWPSLVYEKPLTVFIFEFWRILMRLNRVKTKFSRNFIKQLMSGAWSGHFFLVDRDRKHLFLYDCCDQRVDGRNENWCYQAESSDIKLLRYWVANSFLPLSKMLYNLTRSPSLSSCWQAESRTLHVIGISKS